MGQTRRAMVRRMDMLPEPSLPSGEEKGGSLRPLPEPKTKRPSRGKRPEITSPVERFEAMPGSPEGTETLPQDPKVAQPIEPIEPMEETTTKRRRKKIMPDATLVNTNNLLGTGGSL